MMERKFKAKSGQVDFTNIRWAPVVNCVLQYRNKILVVERSKSLRLYPGYWNGISGFLDDQKSLRQKVIEELREELSLSKSNVVSIKSGQVFDQEAPKYNKTWIVHPVLIKINTDKIKLDWEAKNYQWIRPKDAKNLKLLPGFDTVLATFFK